MVFKTLEQVIYIIKAPLGIAPPKTLGVKIFLHLMFMEHSLHRYHWSHSSVYFDGIFIRLTSGVANHALY